MPDLKFAELIDGVVYMPSPQTSDHGRAEIRVDTWLGTYIASTPGCDAGSQSTWLMLQSTPQPDCYLWVRPEFGGQSTTQGKFHIGAPELATRDLHYERVVRSWRQEGTVSKRPECANTLRFSWSRRRSAGIAWSRESVRTLPPTSNGVFRSRVFPGLWLDGPALWKYDLARLLHTLQRGLRSAEHAAFVAKLAARKH